MQHEQQHQELMLMDLKYNFSCNPLNPSYQIKGYESETVHEISSQQSVWHAFSGSTTSIGANPKEGFCWDNETPKHNVTIEPFKIASKLVTCEAYLEFIRSGGYENPQWWLADGWDYIQKNHLKAPLYWRQNAGRWNLFTLSGEEALDPRKPVSHVTYYEADAFARWSGARLPTEFEWEHAIKNLEDHEDFSGVLWQWTSSPYAAYPGYKPYLGSLGEYNGKFMCNQFVLRGGASITPKGHFRNTYRNFLLPA